MENTHRHLGAIADPRSPEEIKKNYPHHEFLDMAIPVVWKINPESSWPVTSVRDQDGSGSCVGQGSAKALEILLGEVMSAKPTYQRRSTQGEGMYLQDAGNIILNIGATTEVACPSQLQSEIEINTPVTVDVSEVIDSYFFIPLSAGIDAIAAAIDQYKHVVWTFNIKYSEWEQNTPTVDPATVSFDGGHCNCGKFYTLLPDGVTKAIVDDDSWGTQGGTIGATGSRLITEDFFNKRCTGVMVFVPLTPYNGPKPQHQWNTNLQQVSMVNVIPNQDVVQLQNALKYLGCMTASVPSTGIFGPLTKAAVIDFQERYTAEILIPAGLTAGNGNVFQFTRAQLNKLFS